MNARFTSRGPIGRPAADGRRSRRRTRNVRTDFGMGVVSDVAGQTIGKDVAFMRSADDAERAGGSVRRLLRAPAHRRRRRADRTAQQSRPAGRLQRARACGSGSGRRQSLPPNPTFSISRISGNGAIEIERQVVGDILALATLPFRSEIARERFRQAQLRAALETLRLAAEVRRAYYRARRAPTSWSACSPTPSRPPRATAQLAEKLGQTGSLNKLDQAREQVFYAEITADLATRPPGGDQRARAADAAARAVGRTISVSDCPSAAGAAAAPAVAAHASKSMPSSHRIDLQIARIELERAGQDRSV